MLLFLRIGWVMVQWQNMCFAEGPQVQARMRKTPAWNSGELLSRYRQYSARWSIEGNFVLQDAPPSLASSLVLYSHHCFIHNDMTFVWAPKGQIILLTKGQLFSWVDNIVWLSWGINSNTQLMFLRYTAFQCSLILKHIQEQTFKLAKNFSPFLWNPFYSSHLNLSLFPNASGPF